MFYNRWVTPRFLMLLVACAGISTAQVSPPAGQQPSSNSPQVRVNMINVCTPGDADQKEIEAALARLPLRPSFAIDMEVARGRSTASEQDTVLEKAAGISAPSGPSPVSNWVRIRHEFPEASPVLNAQYSFSVAEKRVSETLVWRFRDPKSVLQLSLSDTVDAAADPQQVAKMDTPVSRVRIERFGKSSLVLARCPDADQSKYEPLFRKASELMTNYRAAVGVKSVVPDELARLGSSSRKTSGPSAATKNSSRRKPQ